MNTPAQQSLFPVKDSLAAVEQEAVARLPITSSNELLSILYTQQNTLLHLLEEAQNQKAVSL